MRHAQTTTGQHRVSGVSQSWNHKLIVADLEAIEELHQIRLAMTNLTRKINPSDNCRMSAVIELSHAMATLERAADHIKAAH